MPNLILRKPKYTSTRQVLYINPVNNAQNLEALSIKGFMG